MVLDGLYKGYGYLKNKETIHTIENYLEVIVHQNDTREIHKTLRDYIKENPKIIIPLKQQFSEYL